MGSLTKSSSWDSCVFLAPFIVVYSEQLSFLISRTSVGFLDAGEEDEEEEEEGILGTVKSFARSIGLI